MKEYDRAHGRLLLFGSDVQLFCLELVVVCISSWKTRGSQALVGITVGWAMPASVSLCPLVEPR